MWLMQEGRTFDAMRRMHLARLGRTLSLTTIEFSAMLGRSVRPPPDGQESERHLMAAVHGAN